MLMLLNRKLIVLKKFYRPFINTKMSSKPDFTKVRKENTKISSKYANMEWFFTKRVIEQS